METSILTSEKENFWSLNELKARLRCLIGSILVVLLIWFICNYYNSMASLAIHFFRVTTDFVQKYFEKFNRLSTFDHYIITSIIGVIFLYCLCSCFTERKMIFLEKIAFLISGILLVVAFFYKFHDDIATDIDTFPVLEGFRSSEFIFFFMFFPILIGILNLCATIVSEENDDED